MKPTLKIRHVLKFVKTFESWKAFEGWNDHVGPSENPPEDDEAFVDKHPEEIAHLENVVFSSIGQKKPPGFWEKFWETLTEHDCWEIFTTLDSELENLSSELHDKTYVKGFDSKNDVPIDSPEFLRVKKEVDKRNPIPLQEEWINGGENRTYYNYCVLKSNIEKKRKSELKKALLKNLFEKNAEAYWELYQKALDSLHQMRGKRAGKKFGF